MKVEIVLDGGLKYYKFHLCGEVFAIRYDHLQKGKCNEFHNRLTAEWLYISILYNGDACYCIADVHREKLHYKIQEEIYKKHVERFKYEVINKRDVNTEFLRWEAGIINTTRGELNE